MPAKPSAVIDTRVICCCEQRDVASIFDQLRKLPDACVDLIYMDPLLNSNRNYEAFWGETKEKRSVAATRSRHDPPRCPPTSRRPPELPRRQFRTRAVAGVATPALSGSPLRGRDKRKMFAVKDESSSTRT
jgi:hypothetical protein